MILFDDGYEDMMVIINTFMFVVFVVMTVFPVYFIQRIVPPHLTSPSQLLLACLEKGLRQNNVNLVSFQLGQGLVYLHLLVDQMRPRLQAILDILSCKPLALQALQNCNAPFVNVQEEMVSCLWLP
jgi:hypothetical protein